MRYSLVLTPRLMSLIDALHAPDEDMTRRRHPVPTWQRCGGSGTPTNDKLAGSVTRMSVA